MPQCKKSNCRVEAVPFGKRYCPEHMREYKRKRAEYEAIAVTLRCCERCGERLTKTRHDMGEHLCSPCDVMVQDSLARQHSENKLRNMLDACTTVDDLKDFIRNHIIP